jgi:type IV pilus assembly protein PilW
MKSHIQTGRSQAGFSLVELMVAMTLSLILMAGALSILYSTKLTSAENERVARVQEAGRTAFELIMQDVRGAGYLGCAKALVDKSTSPPTSSFSTGLNSTALLWNFGQSVYGFHATSATAWSPALDPAIPASPAPAGGSDILVVRTARPGAPVYRTNAPFAANAAIPVDRDSTVPAPTALLPMPFVISDCRGAAVFVASGMTTAGSTGTILHAAGGGPPGNNTDSLARGFDIDALVQPVQTVIYYVANCTAAGPNCNAVTPLALWQVVGSGTAVASAPQELIQGIQAMQVLYGVDTDADLLANSYVTADAVTDWSAVVSVNLAVLAESIDQTGREIDKRTYSLLGTNFGPFNDRRQRSVFVTTITLRNGTT